MQLTTATLLYAGWLLVLGLLNAHVVWLGTRPERLAADHDPLIVRRIRYGMWLPIALGIAAVACAYAAPVWVLGILVLGPILGTIMLRQLVRAPSAPAVAAQAEGTS
ncbi:MAG: hypothetical protein EOP59_01675 [Sphingomonadales bacterium]|nr:MAG: hypothetical protein EOP59_01675 [Sphingomonadales bacterium]